MEAQKIILLVLLIIGGWASNKINTALFGFIFKDWFDSIRSELGQRGLNFRIAIGLMLMDIPGLLIGKDPTLNIICTSSAVFALIMFIRNRPLKLETN